MGGSYRGSLYYLSATATHTTLSKIKGLTADMTDSERGLNARDAVDLAVVAREEAREDAARSLACETERASDGARSLACETERASDGARSLIWETERASDGARLLICETERASDGARLLIWETERAWEGARDAWEPGRRVEALEAALAARGDSSESSALLVS